MKYFLNTKKILKASVALGSIVLFGCTQTSDGDNYQSYQEDVQIVDYGVADEGVVFFEADEQEITCTKNKKIQSVQKSVSVSTPAEPRVVPVKPADKCATCKTEQAEVAEDITVKHKPQVPPAPVVEIETVAPALTIEEVEVSDTKAEDEFPVIEETIENNQAPVEDEEEFVVIEETVDETVITDVQDDEAERLAAQKKAEQEAERLRLQQEVDRLAAEKKALEEEKIRITQIKRTTVESCEDVKDWVATEGTTLRSLLMEWGDRVGWRVVWNMDRDYTLEAGAVFRGRFVDVAAALIRSFARAVPAPKGVFYKGNKVLVVSTREDENAD